MATMFKRGFKAVKEESVRQEENRKKMNGNLWKFFLAKDGDEADITFLTEQPINYYEHNIKSHRNGKEIYEGDIVKYEAGCNTVTEEVVYDKNFAGFGVKDADAVIIFTFGELAEDIGLHSLEVIGNIYENPELLGE